MPAFTGGAAVLDERSWSSTLYCITNLSSGISLLYEEVCITALNKPIENRMMLVYKKVS